MAEPSRAQSAPISVINHEDMFGTDVPTSYLDTVPIVRWGQTDELDLYRVRGALLLSDGTLVVADGSERLYFLSQTAPIHSVGGEGDGPGEFRNIRMIDRIGGDSILVHDGWLRRVSVYSGSGEFVRSERVPRMAGATRRASAVGAFSDGSVALWQEEVAPMREPGSYRHPGRLALFRDGEIFVVKGAPGEEIFVAGPLPGERMWRSTRAPISRKTLASTHGRRLYLVDTGRPVISVYEFETPVMEIHDLAELQPITRQIMAWLEERGLPSSAIGHTTLPFLESMLTAGTGDLWLLPLPASMSPNYRQYTVLRSDGSLKRRVVIPDRYKVLWVEEDRVVTLSHDDLGIQVVSIFGLDPA